MAAYLVPHGVLKKMLSALRGRYGKDYEVSQKSQSVESLLDCVALRIRFQAFQSVPFQLGSTSFYLSEV